MSTATTIKVPQQLRDRLAARAHASGRSLAGEITHALDRLEEGEFWAEVRRAHGALTDDDRQEVLSEPLSLDGLLDPADMQRSKDNAW